MMEKRMVGILVGLLLGTGSRAFADLPIEVKLDKLLGKCAVYSVFPPAYGTATAPATVTWEFKSKCDGPHDVQIYGDTSKCLKCQSELPPACAAEAPLQFDGPDTKLKNCTFLHGIYGYYIEVCQGLYCYRTDPEIWINETLTPEDRYRAEQQVLRPLKDPKFRKRGEKKAPAKKP